MDNEVGTANLLEFARTLKTLKKIVNFSTDEVFGPASIDYMHKETDAYLPSNPYSASKAGAASLGYSYFITYGLPVITTYTVNNFGERQHPEKLIPKAIRSIIRGEKMPIFAELKDGELVGIGSRFWLHCQNTASAILFLLENGANGEAYNVATFDEFANEDIVRKIAKIIGKEPIIEFVDFHKVRPGHDQRYALDATKLYDMGWKAITSFDESLKQTVEFTLNNPKWQ